MGGFIASHNKKILKKHLTNKIKYDIINNLINKTSLKKESLYE